MARSSLGIRFRIFGGSAVLVAFSLVLAGFGAWELTTIETEVDQLVTLADGSNAAVEISQLIERTGRLALHYKATGNPASMEGSEKAQAAAIALVRRGVRDTRSDDRRQNYQAMERELTDYQTMWNNGVALTRQSREQRPMAVTTADALLAAVDPMLTAVLALNDPALEHAAGALERSVSALRVSNARFLAGPDAEALAGSHASYEKFRALLDAFAALGPPAELQPLIAQTRKALETYVAVFASLADSLIKTNELFDQRMRPKVEDLVTRSASLQNTLRQDFTATKQSVTQSISATIATQGIVGLVALVLGSSLALLVGRSIIRPVTGMTVAMAKLAAGDTSIDIPSRNARDEMGSMAKAVEVFRQSALDRVRLAAEQVERDRGAAQEKRASMLSLADGFERSVGGIVAEVASASAEMERTARSMAEMAERASGQAATVASAAFEATNNVRMVAQATEELRASISGINQQVVRSTQMALQAVEEARRTDDTVKGLAGGASKIGDVVSLIQTIASQTNLLALNATIEAARAGEAGKGFAVVASEVKGLAGQTAKATQDIASQITAIQSATAEAVTAIQGIGAKIAQMNEVSTGIAAAIEQQGSATHAIAGSVGEATRGTESVSSNIAGVTDASTEVGAAASQVLRAASGMSIGSARMKTEVSGFLATLRAA
jgi:methyl-accepting chemotaxis protein